MSPRRIPGGEQAGGGTGDARWVARTGARPDSRRDNGVFRGTVGGAMGLLGRYLDHLPDEAKDRIIRAQEWEPAASPRDLLGHAEIGRPGRRVSWMERWSLRAAFLLTFGPAGRLRLRRRFARLVRRSGTLRAVRLLKLRASKPFRPGESRHSKERS